MLTSVWNLSLESWCGTLIWNLYAEALCVDPLFGTLCGTFVCGTFNLKPLCGAFQILSREPLRGSFRSMVPSLGLAAPRTPSVQAGGEKEKQNIEIELATLSDVLPVVGLLQTWQTSFLKIVLRLWLASVSLCRLSWEHAG